MCALPISENVPGILTIAADGICEDLESKGYNVGIFSYEALAVGAPHRRSRVFFVAHSNSKRRQEQRSAIPEKEKFKCSECYSRRGIESRMGGACNGLSLWMDRYWNWGIPKVNKGIPNRVSRLKALGNAVVPAQVVPIFKAIMEADKYGY